MIGKKVRVFWPVDESWYSGTVQKYDSSTGEHLLQYQDGDTEWVKIGENSSAGGAGGGSPPGPSGPPPPMMDPYGGPPQPGSPGGGDPSKYQPMGEMGQMGGYGGYAGPHGSPPGYHGGGYPGMHQHGGMAPYRMYPPYGPGPMGYPPMTPGDVDKEGSPGSSGGKRKSGPKAWTKEEDALLLSIVKTMQMPMKWSIVAQSLPDRTGKQCRERYVNHLNPRLKVTDWNALEDSMVFHLYNSIGSHWAKMSKIIPGRTDNGIKNRFHNLRRQFEREDEHRLRLSTTHEFKDAIRLDRLRKFPDSMEGKASKLWDMHSGIGILAAQSIMGGNIGRTKNCFGPFRKATDGEMCVRCGFMLPSLQTGDEICEKSGWCQSCTRIPPHVSSNLLRECLNLRREQDKERRVIVESWVEYFSKDAEPSSQKQEGGDGVSIKQE